MGLDSVPVSDPVPVATLGPVSSVGVTGLLLAGGGGRHTGTRRMYLSLVPAGF